MAGLTDEQIERYSRQLVLPEVSGAGQSKLLEARVLVVGAGGLGSPCALYLAAAGVGTIGIVDHDLVEVNNLQRQILHATHDVGRPKTRSGKETLEALNPDVNVVAHELRLTSDNALDVIGEYDVVVDGSDNFATKYLLNDACVLSKRPLSHAGILRFEGQTITIVPGQGPCFRCLFPEPPARDLTPTCQDAGVLGAVAGVLGCIQASEVLKLILGKGDLLIGRLFVFDLFSMRVDTLRLTRNEGCPICGPNPALTGLIDYEEFCQRAEAG